MEVDELIGKLEAVLADSMSDDPRGGEEDWHREADGLLLAYVDDERVTAAFSAIPKWYF